MYGSGDTSWPSSMDSTPAGAADAVRMLALTVLLSHAFVLAPVAVQRICAGHGWTALFKLARL